MESDLSSEDSETHFMITKKRGDVPRIQNEKEFTGQFPVSRVPEVSSYKPLTISYKIPALAAIASVIVLEEAADELAILGRIGNLPDATAKMEYQTLAERFDVYDGDVRVFDPITIEPYEMALNKQKFIKFQKDRSFVENILKETIRNLLKDGSFTYLINQLNQHDQKFYEENQLLDKEVENKAKLNEIHNFIEFERREMLKQIQKSSENIGMLKDKFEDILCESKIKCNYVDNWELSRTEQNSLILDRSEEVYLNIINGVKLEIERETRIDAEIENFIRETQQQYEEDIQIWRAKYDQEIEIRDTEIQVLKGKREDQFLKLQDISKLYATRKNEIEQYLAVKEQRRKEEAILQHRHKAATKIQAWWRGLMFRKGFGEFRKKKGKKDSGKKKGKK